jgi:hypothetical protein
MHKKLEPLLEKNIFLANINSAAEGAPFKTLCTSLSLLKTGTIFFHVKLGGR